MKIKMSIEDYKKLVNFLIKKAESPFEGVSTGSYLNIGKGELMDKMEMDEEELKKLLEAIIEESDGAIKVNCWGHGMNNSLITLNLSLKGLKTYYNLLKEKVASRPYCEIREGWGYLKFGERGEEVKIGKAGFQPFKLLESLIEPRVGLAKSVDTVFEAIRENIKYKSKTTGVYNPLDRTQKINLIKYTIKELQKGKKLKGKLKFKWNEMKSKIWLEYTG